MKAKKFIDFIITQKCTYRCEYCSQSKVQQNNYKEASKETIENFLKFLDKIEKDFEITITGGEAILHKDFYYLIKEVKNKGFNINLITNLSSEIEKYEKIFNIISDSLNRFDVSVHFDELSSFNQFIDKLEKIILIKPKTAKITLNIPIFKLNNKKTEEIKIIEDIAKNNSIKCNFQHIRILNKFIKYKEEEQKYFKNEKVVKSYAKECYAGHYSAVIYEDGSVYRCYSSRFTKTNYLGNINDKGFELNKNTLPCVFKNCTCPKPMLYDQLCNKKNYLKTFAMQAINFTYFPILLIKKIGIIKNKLEQYSKTKFL